METVNTHEAKTHLSRLLERVAAGESFVIAKAGRPIARLVAYEPEPTERIGGVWKGRVRIGKDFDDPLPLDLERAFTEPGE